MNSNTDAGNTSQQTCEPIYQSPIVSHSAPLAVTPPDEPPQRDQHWGVLPRAQGRLAEQGYVPLPDFMKKS